MYITTDQPVRKDEFLEPALMSAVKNLDESEINKDLIGSIKDIHRMLEYARSDDYYWLFHNYLLDLSYYDYDAHFLEEHYSFFLLTLFDSAHYQRAVMEDESFAAKEEYEDRQHRSNRVCLKRVLKEYNKVSKAMEQGDYSMDDFKEFLLKFREDYGGLFHYYAVGKKELEVSDLFFLEETARKACMDASVQISRPDIIPVLEKLDRLSQDTGTAALVRSFASILPHDEKVEAYSRLKNNSMTEDEILALPKEEQLKLINSMPLSWTIC